MKTTGGVGQHVNDQTDTETDDTIDSNTAVNSSIGKMLEELNLGAERMSSTSTVCASLSFFKKYRFFQEFKGGQATSGVVQSHVHLSWIF